MNKKITKNYLNVLRCRLSKSNVPNYNQLLLIAQNGATKKELRQYIRRAKKAYSSLLNINNTKSKDTIAIRNGGE